MRLFNHCFLLSVLSMTVSFTPLAAAPTATTAPPPTAPILVGGVWTTIPNSQAGNCNGYDVNTMVNDAKTLAQNAITAIKKLQRQWPQRADSETLKLFHTAGTSWGVGWIGESVGWIRVSSGRDTLDTALKNYDKALKVLSGSNPDPGRQERLMCTDAGWKYVTKKKDIGKTPADEPLEGITTTQPGFSLNSYFSLLVPDIEYDSSGQYGSRICTPYNSRGQQLTPSDAITWEEADLIMMCASAFNGATLSGRISGQAELPVGTTLDSQQVPGAVFLHEMMHYIRKNIVDVVITLADGSKHAAYGSAGTIHLVMDPAYDGKAVVNADNYRHFAMAVTLSAIDWSISGKKEPASKDDSRH